MNSVLDTMCSNFHVKGYSIAHINIENDRLLIIYRYDKNELNILVYIDGNSNISPHLIVRTVDSVRAELIDGDTSQVNVLQLVSVNGNNKCNVNDIISPFFPYWIIDERENRIIIYEHQPADFGDAGSIIEDTLDGIRYSGNDYDYILSARHFPVITAVIAAINIIVYVIMEINGSTLDTEYMLAHGALRYTEVVSLGQYYRLITHFFLHFGIEHIINNMFVLIVLGYHMENLIGRWRLFVIYMLSGLLSGIVSMNWYYYIGQDSVSAGASGAIFGITGALFALFFINHGKLYNISYTRIVLFLALTLYSGVRNAEIDLVAHIAGFAAGALIMLILVLMGRGRLTVEGTGIQRKEMNM